MCRAAHRLPDLEQTTSCASHLRKWDESEVKVAQSCPTLCDPIDHTVHGILQARILEWVAFPSSRGIFPTHGSNPGLPHCRWILYQLSYRGSPSKMEGSSQSIIVLCAIRGFPLELLFLEVSKL